ncbi:hypothetical protein MUP46_04725 [Patescibacteria group bacterium]|nr:hypothetical protein [Patescibacteria group bacterium]
MAKIALDPNQVLSVGDHVELHFKSTGLTWIKATQIYLLEKKLEGRTDFRVDSIGTPTLDPTSLVFTIEVLKSNPVAVTATYIALIIIGFAAGGIIFKLCFETAYLLTIETLKTGVEAGKETAEAIKEIATGPGLLIIGGIVLLLLLRSH